MSESTSGKRAVLSLFAIVALLGCGGGDGGDGGGACDPYCDARDARGCGGVRSACESVCQALYVAAEAEGSCSEEALAVEDCKNSPRAVEVLGCEETFQETQQLCGEPMAALESCQAERDN